MARQERLPSLPRIVQVAKRLVADRQVVTDGRQDSVERPAVENATSLAEHLAGLLERRLKLLLRADQVRIRAVGGRRARQRPAVEEQDTDVVADARIDGVPRGVLLRRLRAVQVVLGLHLALLTDGLGLVRLDPRRLLVRLQAPLDALLVTPQLGNLDEEVPVFGEDADAFALGNPAVSASLAGTDSLLARREHTQHLLVRALGVLARTGRIADGVEGEGEVGLERREADERLDALGVPAKDRLERKDGLRVLIHADVHRAGSEVRHDEVWVRLDRVLVRLEDERATELGGRRVGVERARASEVSFGDEETGIREGEHALGELERVLRGERTALEEKVRGDWSHRGGACGRVVLLEGGLDERETALVRSRARGGSAGKERVLRGVEMQEAEEERCRWRRVVRVLGLARDTTKISVLPSGETARRAASIARNSPPACSSPTPSSPSPCRQASRSTSRCRSSGRARSWVRGEGLLGTSSALGGRHAGRIGCGPVRRAMVRGWVENGEANEETHASHESHEIRRLVPKDLLKAFACLIKRAGDHAPCSCDNAAHSHQPPCPSEANDSPLMSRTTLLSGSIRSASEMSTPARMT